MAGSTVITIGNFDGVHAGHARILRLSAELAQQRGGRVVAITFDPPPAAILRPGNLPGRLMETDEKVPALKRAGADEVVVLETTRELLSLSADEFVRQLIAKHHPFAIVEGGDFHFGKDRKGDVSALRSLGGELGFEVHEIGKVEVVLSDQLRAPLSSTLVRWLLANGRVADAARCLGRFYGLSAKVIEGEKRGRTLGVPTANLDTASLASQMIPCDGVYAGAAVLPNGIAHAAAISIGVKPTFQQNQRTIEAHLLDFAGDLYGQRVTLEFHAWLRDQQPFPGLEALKAQIGRDIGRTRRWREIGRVAVRPANAEITNTKQG